MLQNKPIHYLSAKEVPFTWRGRNLKELRRAELRPIAKALKIPSEGTKNDLLYRIVNQLKAMGVEAELSELDAE